MKTLRRILLILAVFVFVMGITYVVVNANSSASTALWLERGEEGFPRPEGMQTSSANRERPDFDGAGPRGSGWIFGLVKNIGVIAIIVALVIVPKRLTRRKDVPVAVR